MSTVTVVGRHMGNVTWVDRDEIKMLQHKLLLFATVMALFTNPTMLVKLSRIL